VNGFHQGSAFGGQEPEQHPEAQVAAAGFGSLAVFPVEVDSFLSFDG
jgi:hypothetical protein